MAHLPGVANRQGSFCCSCGISRAKISIFMGSVMCSLVLVSLIHALKGDIFLSDFLCLNSHAVPGKLQEYKIIIVCDL